MKKLFLASLMVMFFGSAVAQQTPKKQKESRSSSDTIKNNKGKTGTYKNSATYKTDTINQRGKSKSTKSQSGNSNRNSQTDSISNMPTP